MPMIEVSQARVGSVLAQPVHSPRGILLAPAGTTLGDTHLSTFASWGVSFIDVVGEVAVREAPPLDDRIVQAVRARLDERFASATLLNPIMREVRRVTEQIMLQREEQAGRAPPGWRLGSI